jgi:allantoinase
MGTAVETPSADDCGVNDPQRIREQIAQFRQTHGSAARPDGVAASFSLNPVSAARDLDLVVRGARVLTTAGVVAREVAVRNGVIVAIEPLGSNLTGTEVVTLTEEEVLIPGLVDTHVHVNEPGRTEWEGFASATKAAAAGGVTTIIDMPLNSIPSTVNRPALEYKRLHAQGQAFVDVGFWGGAVPGNQGDLRSLYDDGVFGFKCFLLHSGVEEFQHLEPDDLERYLAELVTFDALMIVHAESSTAIGRAPHAEGDQYGRFLASRPRGAENLAIAEVIERTRWTGARSHVLHLSSSDALPMIRSAKADGIRITVETCPHYLTLLAEEVPNGATAYKCCPPIREVGNRELLWEGLLDGTIDDIASDHSPSTLDLKDLDNGDFGVAWGGIASIQLGLPLIWTEARRRGIGLERVVAWMADKPAQRVGLRSKGRLALGYDADLVVFAPDEAFVVDAHRLHHKNPLTPYQGKVLSGVVRRTFLRGTQIDYTNPRGALLRRGA